MRTLIVGTGVIGVIYGWALSEAGEEVTHFVRPGRTGMCAGGVELDLLDEREGHPDDLVTTYRLSCIEDVSPDDAIELVIVPTNSYQAEAALRQLAPRCGDATFLVFAANWEGTGFIDRHLPHDRYLLGYPDGGGTQRDELYWTNLGPEVHLGKVEGGSDERLAAVSALFAGADMEPDVQDQILHWLWVHNALAVGLWAGFPKHDDMEAMLRDRALLREGFLSTRELLELCRRRGADIKKYPDARYMSWPLWLLIPIFRRLYRKNESMQRYTAHAAESLAEAKYNHDQMRATARALGFDMPHTDAFAVYLDDVLIPD